MKYEHAQKHAKSNEISPNEIMPSKSYHQIDNFKAYGGTSVLGTQYSVQETSPLIPSKPQKGNGLATLMHVNNK